MWQIKDKDIDTFAKDLDVSEILEREKQLRAVKKHFLVFFHRPKFSKQKELYFETYSKQEDITGTDSIEWDP